MAATRPTNPRATPTGATRLADDEGALVAAAPALETREPADEAAEAAELVTPVGAADEVANEDDADEEDYDLEGGSASALRVSARRTHASGEVDLVGGEGGALGGGRGEGDEGESLDHLALGCCLQSAFEIPRRS